MAGRFKPSLYNFFIPEDDDGGIFLFNGLHSSLIRLPRQLYSIAKDVLSLEQLDISAIPYEILPLFNTLKEGGFLIENVLDELDIIKERFRSCKEDGPLHLIVAPTLDCNLACKYCYQSRLRGIMTVDTCNSVIEFTRQKLKKGNVNDIKVDWYGGEPLLAPKIITYLSEHFLSLSKEFKCTYEASIATNGTLLDYRVVKMLVSNQVKSCQVTIDGPKEIHDTRRMFRKGNGSSFDCILKNIKQIIGRMELSVRINVDADNVQHAHSILDIFKKEGFFQNSDFGFFPYIAMVSPINPCMPFNCKPISISKFYEHSLEFRKRAFEYSGKKHLEPVLDFPLAVNAVCGALRRNTYAFDPEGCYFKCGLEIGENGKECGHVGDKTEWEQCKKWEQYNPFDDKECLRCRYLPFCMGNCPKTEFDENSFYDRDGCIYWKGNLEDIVRFYVKAMEQISATGCEESNFIRERIKTIVALKRKEAENANGKRNKTASSCY